MMPRPKEPRFVDGNCQPAFAPAFDALTASQVHGAVPGGSLKPYQPSTKGLRYGTHHVDRGNRQPCHARSQRADRVPRRFRGHLLGDAAAVPGTAAASNLSPPRSFGLPTGARSSAQERRSNHLIRRSGRRCDVNFGGEGDGQLLDPLRREPKPLPMVLAWAGLAGIS